MTTTSFLRITLVVPIVLFCAAPTSAVITVTSNEVWDGMSNPHVGDGVTLAGGVYVIPDELVIGSGATIFLNDPATRFDDPGNVPTEDITFEFTPGSGGLTFTDARSTIDIHAGSRIAEPVTFSLNMQDNDIRGAGRLVNGPFVGLGATGDAMSVNINSLANVSLAAIEIGRNDATWGDINITAEGSITIGSLDTSDVSVGGDRGGNVNITGQSLTLLGNIDTRAFRSDGRVRNGDVSLVALDPPTFDPANGIGNRLAENVITIGGSINTDTPSNANTGGNVSLTAVKVVLGRELMLNQSPSATAIINVGETDNRFREADLYIDMAATGLAANFVVEHGIPEPTAVTMLLCGGLALAYPPHRRRASMAWWR